MEFWQTFISKEFLTYDMESGIVRVTDKGQISLPVRMQRAAHIQKGDELLLVCRDNRIIMEKVTERTFRDLLMHSEAVAKKLWSSHEDDVWDKL